MDFPLFLFPSESLKFGHSSAAYYGNGASNVQVTSSPRLAVVNDWHKVAPKTRICDRSIPANETEKQIKSMVHTENIK